MEATVFAKRAAKKLKDGVQKKLEKQEKEAAGEVGNALATAAAAEEGGDGGGEHNHRTGISLVDGSGRRCKAPMIAEGHGGGGGGHTT